jgi:hypothetical protein
MTRVSDEQLDITIRGLERMKTTRQASGGNPYCIDDQALYPRVFFSDVEGLLKELQERRNQDAWVRKMIEGDS